MNLIVINYYFLSFIFFAAMEWSRISDDAKNLIQKMLTFDVDQRISASQALNNEWIQKNAPNNPLDSNVLLNLGNFHVI